MPLAYDQSLISASSASGFQLDLLPDDAANGQPALIDPDDLPADPKHAVWALAAAQHHAQKRLPQKSSFTTFKNSHSHEPHGAPMVSTFSASNLGHIHIVQPYLPNPANSQPNPTDSAGGQAALSNGCSTSTFSVHPTSASTPYSFSNPYCTNQIHSLIPGMGSGPGGPGQPPRPANAWILYRSDKMKDIAPALPGQPKPPQADISKVIAAMWKAEQPEVRQHYEALSDMKKAEHLALYPGYRFQPMKKADREKVRAERKAEKEKERLAAAAKSHRRPKARRAATEETVATEDNDAENRQDHQQQQHQGHTANPDATSPLSPARARTFAYQPYAVPSPTPASPSVASASAVPARRKRARTKVEASTPAIPSEEQAQQSEYVPVPQHSVQVTNTFFEHHGDGRPAADYQYSSPNGMHHGYNISTPQLSSGSNSDPNSHPTPPYNTVHPSTLAASATTPPNALSATLDPDGGQQGIFHFTDFDANLLGADIELTLPQDFSLDLMDGLGLGLEDSGLGFDVMGGGSMGFAEFGNMASSGPMEELTMGFHDYSLVDKGNLSVDPNSLSYGSNPHDVNMGLQYVDGYGMSCMDPSGGNNARSPQHLNISTHAPQHASSDRMSIPPSATSEQFNVTSPQDSAPGYYSSFAHPQQQYNGMEQYRGHQGQQNQHYYRMHGYGSPPQAYAQHHAQGYTSPTHSYASPPPPSALDNGSATGAPTGEMYGASGASRGAPTSWR